MMFLFKKRYQLIFVEFKIRGSAVGRLDGFPMLFFPIKAILNGDLPVFLMSCCLGVYYWDSEQLLSIRAIDMCSISIGLFLIIILSLHYQFLLMVYNNNPVSNARKICRMYQCLHLYGKKSVYDLGFLRFLNTLYPYQSPTAIRK